MIANTSHGSVEGHRVRHGYAFLGIPYARAPYPDGAFDEPGALLPWSGVRQAKAMGPTAHRPTMAAPMFPEPEIAGNDCLNLNLFTPGLAPARHPVIVWIHGGGFVTGCNASPWYSGESFVRDGVVLATVNYRLGAEGFLTLEDAPDNRGLLDIIAALEWLQVNLASFGGDPRAITLAGQSAGAMAAIALAGRNGAAGLFSRVAAFSPASEISMSPERARSVAERYCSDLGVPRTRDAVSSVALEDRLEIEAGYLPRGMMARRPEHRDQRSSGEHARRLNWQPVRADDEPEPVTWGNGDIDALLIGTTTEEWNFTVSLPSTETSPEALRQAASALGIESAALDAYVGALRNMSRRELAAQMLTDRTFRGPARQLADAAALHGIPTFAYQFAWKAPSLGAAHCTDLPFWFDHLAAPGVEKVLGRTPPQALATTMHGALVQFAVSGTAGWPAYTQPARRTMVFDATTRVDSDPFGSAHLLGTGRPARRSVIAADS